MVHGEIDELANIPAKLPDIGVVLYVIWTRERHEIDSFAFLSTFQKPAVGHLGDQLDFIHMERQIRASGHTHLRRYDSYSWVEVFTAQWFSFTELSTEAQG